MHAATAPEMPSSPLFPSATSPASSSSDSDSPLSKVFTDSRSGGVELLQMYSPLRTMRRDATRKCGAPGTRAAQAARGVWEGAPWRPVQRPASGPAPPDPVRTGAPQT